MKKYRNRTPIASYPKDFLLLDKLGSQFPPYKPTFLTEILYLNDHHRFYSCCPTKGDLIEMGIKGFLRQADALKLYELAYHSLGDILEMGSAWGLSTSILCQAIADSGRYRKVISLEIDPLFYNATCRQIAELHLADYLESHRCDAREFCPVLIKNKRQVGFAFIDHCHSYEATCVACQHLQELIMPGGFVLFHDFNDERNRTDFPAFGVYQGVVENLSENQFIFLGIFGCSALYRKQTLTERLKKRWQKFLIKPTK